MKKNFTLFILLAVTTFSKPVITHAQVNVQDSLALVDLYDSTDGVNWKYNNNWLTVEPVSNWWGVGVTGNRITRLGDVRFAFLNNNYIKGKIPFSFGNLTALDTLVLDNNYITGNLPFSLANLINLKYISLNHNKIEGNISSYLGQLTKLEYLDLSYNKFTGAIPSALNNQLSHLSLAHNEFTENISALANIHFSYLHLEHNKLTGSMPNLRTDSLKECDLDSNQLTGAIPDSLVNINNLNLSYNMLSGSIPKLKQVSVIIDYFKLQSSLNLSHNQLSGKLPIINYRNNVDLSYNNLSGNIADTTFNDTGIGIYTILVYNVNLSHNNLSGKIPAVNFVLLENLDLSYNNFTGSVPALNVAQMGCDEDGCNYPENFISLNLSHNQLSGNIPNSVMIDQYGFPYEFLSDVELDNNQLTGQIPALLGDLKHLQNLTLNNNQFTDTIPKELAGIQILALYNNKLTGKIPVALYSNYSSKYLYLSNNKLSGSITDSISISRNLTDFDVSFNQLTGTLPTGIGNLKTLRYLTMNDNKFTGSIPLSFDSLTHLVSLKLQHNQLSGTVPSLNDLSLAQKISLRSNKLLFSGLERLTQRFGNSVALYYDQAIIPLHVNNNVLSVTAGGTLSNNRYRLFKDGLFYATHTGDSTFIITESGSYYIDVSNAVATGLKLYSDTLTVSGFNKPAATIALYPNPAKSNATALFNATGNYTLMLSNASGKVLQTITGTSNKVQNKVDFNISSYPQGMYFISIKDEKETRLLKLTKE